MSMTSSVRGARIVLLVMTALGVASVGSAVATVQAKPFVKKVKLTVEVSQRVTLAGRKGQCLITTDGYNIDFDAEDYPSLGPDGELASGGPGPATDPDLVRQYLAFSATIDGTFYVEDDSGGLDAITSAVKLNVKRKTIRFTAYPIVAPETQTKATMSGVVKCR